MSGYFTVADAWTQLSDTLTVPAQATHLNFEVRTYGSGVCYWDDFSLRPPCTGASVFINELHYDDASTDANEGFEIAGPAGTDLSGWEVWLYNGKDGASYLHETLSGTLPDASSSGFGAKWFDRKDIQNGAPDGLALVDNKGSVVQFISYEGSFTASNGPVRCVHASSPPCVCD